MKTVVRCDRCKAQVDIEEGTKLATCYAQFGKDFKAHSVEVDAKSDAGAAILKHIERKPVAVMK